MKHLTKRLLALALSLMMLWGLAAPALADGPELPEGLTEEELAELLLLSAMASEMEEDDDIYVGIDVGDFQLSKGDSTTVSATCFGNEEGASLSWHSSDSSVVSVRGSGDSATVSAKGTGTATITVTASNKHGGWDSDSIDIEVRSASTPLRVTGGGSRSLNAGEEVSVSASVSGGSGDYSYEWDASGCVTITDRMRKDATVQGTGNGSGSVTLTVIDNEDRSNNSSTTWDFTVKAAAQSPSLEISRGSITLGAGNSASLQALASGGSGKYTYYWESDNTGVATVRGSGASADVVATSTPSTWAKSCEITCYVKDNETGLLSDTCVCLVAVEGGQVSYDVGSSATVGSHLSLNAMANNIASEFRRQFGETLSYSASVRLSSTRSGAGSICFQDGNVVLADNSYTFAVLQDMYFNPAGNGEFSSYYIITDGGNTIQGEISVSVMGGKGVMNASLTPGSVGLSTYSSQYLNLSVSPADAKYAVTWSTSNSGIVSVSGSGNSVTLKSGGRTGNATVTATIVDSNSNVLTRSVNVSVSNSSRDDDSSDYDFEYSPTLTVTLGSDYYGTSMSDSMYNQFRQRFRTNLTDDAVLRFSNVGQERYGELRMPNGSTLQTYAAYTFRDFINMYFAPKAAGTFTATYGLTCKGNVMRGTMTIYVRAASLTVNMNTTNVTLAPYTNQTLSLSVLPAGAYYRTTWTSSNPNVATVQPNGTTAVVNAVGVGTANITATVTDGNGVEIRRSCTVVVQGTATSFNPAVTTTLGVPYMGTGTSQAMRNQFASLYKLNLDDNAATIRFSTTGNNSVAIMRLADGTQIQPNTNYTFAQYVKMYTQPVSAGVFSLPYTLTYLNNSLTGTINVNINSANLSAYMLLDSDAPYSFASNTPNGTAAAVFAATIQNAIGTSWSYLTFTSASDLGGTLYQNSFYAPLTPTTKVTAAEFANLFFVPGTLSSFFTARFNAYTASGGLLGTGTLNIRRGGITFTDVPTDAYYATAMNWALSMGVTAGNAGTLFYPDTAVTRAQAVAFLWYAMGQPQAVNPYNPFVDVAPTDYFYNAVMWAVQQGITSGTSYNTFSPNAPVSRDQVLSFLCRSTGIPCNGADWSQQAVTWAYSRGLLAGVPGDFLPNADCPRRDMVYYLWRYFS